MDVRQAAVLYLQIASGEEFTDPADWRRWFEARKTEEAQPAPQPPPKEEQPAEEEKPEKPAGPGRDAPAPEENDAQDAEQF